MVSGRLQAAAQPRTATTHLCIKDNLDHPTTMIVDDSPLLTPAVTTQSTQVEVISRRPAAAEVALVREQQHNTGLHSISGHECLRLIDCPETSMHTTMITVCICWCLTAVLLLETSQLPRLCQPHQMSQDSLLQCPRLVLPRSSTATGQQTCSLLLLLA